MTPDEWWEVYKSLSKHKSHEFLRDTLKQEISDEMVEKNDFSDLILDEFHYFTDEKMHDELLEMRMLIKQHNPYIMGDRKYRIGTFASDIHAFRKTIDLFSECMLDITENPDQSIDDLIAMTNRIAYYGYYDLAQHISREVYSDITESKKLSEGAESDFAAIILTTKLQIMYERFCEGLTVDRDEFYNDITEYGFDGTDEIDFIIDRVLTEDDSLQDLVYEDYMEKGRVFFNSLLFAFCKYALKQKNINFAAAYDIWTGAWANFACKNDINSDGDTLKYFFTLEKDDFFDFVTSRAGFMSNKKPFAFAVLWGLPYVYDFLQKNKFVDLQIYMETLEYINCVKMELIEGIGNDLWKYNFVHSWDMPDSINTDDYQKEKDLFEQTFYEKININDYIPQKVRSNDILKHEGHIAETKKQDEQKVGRNSPCPCGSGKKYKKCCGK